jgi:hypothetical protein
MSKMSRQIVVDASIARSAGDGIHPASQMSRQFLLDMMTICHRVVTSPDITLEWQKHTSRFNDRVAGCHEEQRQGCDSPA